MSHHAGSVSPSQFFQQSKILFSEWPGTVGLLVDNGKQTEMHFKGAHDALDWCETNKVSFYYLPPEPVEGN